MENNAIEIKGSYLPRTTWNWIKINDAKITLPCNNCQIPRINISKADIMYTGKALEQTGIKELYEKCRTEVTGAMGSQYDEWLNTNCSDVLLVLDTDSDKPIELSLEGENSVIRIFVYVKTGVKSELSIFIKSGNNISGAACISVMAYLEKDSVLGIRQVQMLSSENQYILDIGSCNEENAGLEVTRINLGAARTYLGLKADLRGREAFLDSRLAYLGRGTQLLDINDIALHKGRATKAKMNVEGVLMEQAWKNYKGTIDLKHGCAGASGLEAENTLLFGDDIVNKSTPLILCREEDVEGNHGATIGRIDDSLLFYMQTRGIDTKKAKELIIRGKLEAALMDIKDKNIVEEAEKYIQEAVSL